VDRWLRRLNEVGIKVLGFVSSVSGAVRDRVGRDDELEDFDRQQHPADAYTFGPLKMTDERREAIERSGQGKRVDTWV
jgi:hypothetical protein